MLCSDCGEKEAFARGLCKTCYARVRRKIGVGKICIVDGCELPAISKGLCSKHAQRSTKRTCVRLISDLPGEAWEKLEGHPKWMISTMGRIKSLRKVHEKLITPRVVNGRLFIDDKKNGSFAVHLQVLKTFHPNVIGDPIFLDGNTLNPALENLKWDTREDKINRAISMAKESNSPWREAFISFWAGEKNALNDFFIYIKDFLSKTLYKKCDEYACYYKLSVEDVAHEALVKIFLAAESFTVKSLDNLKGYALAIADNVLKAHWKYASILLSDTKYTDEGEINLIEKLGYNFSSAESVALFNEQSYVL